MGLTWDSLGRYMGLLFFKYLLEMCPSLAVVFYTVALGVWGIVGYLLTTIEFALLWIDGVDVGFVCTLVAYYLVFLVLDWFALHSVPCWTVETYTG